MSERREDLVGCGSSSDDESSRFLCLLDVGGLLVARGRLGIVVEQEGKKFLLSANRHFCSGLQIERQPSKIKRQMFSLLLLRTHCIFYT